MEGLVFPKRRWKLKKVEEIECYSKEEKYGFKSVMKPHAIKEMEEFEKEFYGMAKNIVFKEDIKLDNFQRVNPNLSCNTFQVSKK